MKPHFQAIFVYWLVSAVDVRANQTLTNDKKNDIREHTLSKSDDKNYDKNSTKTMVLDMNIIGHNVEVNFDQNQKTVTAGAQVSKEVKSQRKSNTYPKYPDYLLEVEPPNSSQVFSRRIDKRSDETFSMNLDSDDRDEHKFLELSVFVDFKAHQNLWSNGLVETEEQFIELILSYINQIQAIYSHKAFVPNFSIHLVKVEIQRADIFIESNGNRDEMLRRFCRYQSDLNAKSDSDPSHWDMALLLTGYDLYVVRDDGTKDYKSLGLGSVAGICTLERNCVISEFEAINTMGELWPSSGLMSTWAAAHEMAHNLGILHDGWPFNIECPSNGYIMSGSRGTRGETNWSQCSAINFKQSYTECLDDRPTVLNERYDHNKYKQRPGTVWASNIQCKLFLRDNKAYEFERTSARICNETILCATPNRLGFYSSGPALEGTECGEDKWCVDGVCQHKHE